MEFGCYLGQGVKGLFGLAERVAPLYLAGYQSKNQLLSSLASTSANRDIQLNQQNTNASMFAAAGQTNAQIAGAGFSTVGGVAGAFAAKPSISVNNSGDYSGFALYDSTADVRGAVTTTTTNTTVTCPTTATAANTAATSGNASGGAAPVSATGSQAVTPSTNPATTGNCTTNK